MRACMCLHVALQDEVTVLLGKFEDCLSLPDSESSDALRQSIVILMGTLARHLDKTDPKVKHSYLGC